MWFNPIYGQNYAVDLFQKAFQNDRLAQSYLFFGPEGVGKKTFTIALATAIQCKEGFGIGCGVCDACKKTLHGSHADYVLIQPLEGKASISIDQIRQLLAMMYRKPQEGRRRIVVIDSIDLMETEAQNALLKLLEEPPQDNIMILLTQRIQQILPTIVSRCQSVRFQSLAPQDVEAILKKQFTGNIPHFVVPLSKGSVAEAKRILADETLMEQWHEMIEWFFQEERWTDLDRTDWISQREKSNWSREVFLLFWETWQSLLRDTLILTANGKPSLLIYPTLLERYLGMKPKSTREITHRLYEIERAILRLKNRGNGPMITEAILMNWRSDMYAESSRRSF